MGRLFQYNRLGLKSSNKKDNSRNKSKTKMTQQALNYSPYSILYPEYNDSTTTLTSTNTSLSPTLTTKSVAQTIKKYQRWSSKLLPTITSTTSSASDCVSQSSKSTLMPTISKKNIVNLCKGSTSTSSSSSSSTSYTSSAYQNLSSKMNNTELIGSDVKKSKVYDSMKDFLRRKFFQHEQQQQQNTERNLLRHEKHLLDLQQKSNDDVTSDYDEIDMFDSSYNADEEDSCSNCSYPLSTATSSSSDDTTEKTSSKTTSQKSSPFKSALSLNCCKNTLLNDTTEDDTDIEESLESDAGISDCCKLIDDKSPKHKSPKYRSKKLQINRDHHYNKDDDGDLSELLATTWYQPRITTKAALDRLLQSEEGSFLVRRKSRTFELCLRVGGKVKNFTVISSVDRGYKLKGAKKEFSTLKALVTHHSVMAEQLPVTLLLPREQLPLSSVRYADDFDTLESMQILGILKCLQAENLEFS